MKNTAIYCRVSTDMQELTQQVEACQKYADYKKLKHDLYAEIGSGKSFKRPEFMKMLEKIRLGFYENVVVFRFDRLGRNAREVVTLFDELETKGVKIHSINENLDTSTPIGRAMRDIIITLAQLERENISEATRHRLQALKNMGKKLGRPKGSKDLKKRKKTGYLLRWNKENG